LSFVNVPVDILDSLDGSNALNIDVTLIFPEQIVAVGNHPAIVNLLAFNLSSMACISGSCTAMGEC
jgi:hypothetical protein